LGHPGPVLGPVLLRPQSLGVGTQRVSLGDGPGGTAAAQRKAGGKPDHGGQRSQDQRGDVHRSIVTPPPARSPASRPARRRVRLQPGGSVDWTVRALTLGIVGLPNVGKSTLFNALTKNSVLAANYPFATIEPNVGVVPLPDARLGVLSQLFESEKTVPAIVSFVDIAGIVPGASEGEGLGNKFLANIREADAICQVIRVFEDDDVVHVEGKVSPEGDIETINTELILADLQTLEKAVPRLEKEARIAKDKKGALDNAVAAQAVLDRGDTLSASGAAAGIDLVEARALSLL